MGCSVLVLDVSAPGAPDLLVAHSGIDQLVEVKPDTKVKAQSIPRENQLAWACNWAGRKVTVCRSVDDAVKVVLSMTEARK